MNGLAQSVAAILGAIVLVGAAAAAIAQLYRYPWFRWMVRPVVGATRAVWAARIEARDQRLAQIIGDVLRSKPMTNGKGYEVLTEVSGQITTLADRIGRIERKLAEVSSMSASNQRSVARQAGAWSRLEGLVARELRLQRLELKAHRAALSVLTNVDTTELDAQLDAIEAALDDADTHLANPGDPRP